MSQSTVEVLTYVLLMSVHFTLTLFEILVIIFLFCEWRRPKSLFRTAYFAILNYGYFIDLIFTVLWVYGHLTMYAPENPLTPVVIIVQWFAMLDLGLWNAILGFNRFTALAFPTLHKKLWNGKSIFTSIILLCLYPFVIDGISFQNPSCKLLYFNSDFCEAQKTRSHLIITISNIVLGFITAGFIIFGIYKAPKQQDVTKQSKMERRLILQTIFFTSFLILIYLFDLFSIIFESYILHITSYICYIIQFYTAIFILFFVSPCFRHGFSKFYRLDCLWNFTQNANSIVVRNFHSVT